MFSGGLAKELSGNANTAVDPKFQDNTTLLDKPPKAVGARTPV